MPCTQTRRTWLKCECTCCVQSLHPCSPCEGGSALKRIINGNTSEPSTRSVYSADAKALSLIRCFGVVVLCVCIRRTTSRQFVQRPSVHEAWRLSPAAMDEIDKSVAWPQVDPIKRLALWRTLLGCGPQAHTPRLRSNFRFTLQSGRHEQPTHEHTDRKCCPRLAESAGDPGRR